MYMYTNTRINENRACEFEQEQGRVYKKYWREERVERNDAI